MKELVLVSMPWSIHTRPSAAQGALAAFVRRERPEVAVRCRSEHVRAAAAIGFPLYQLLADNAYSLGELLYMTRVYPERTESVRQAFLEQAPRLRGEPRPEAQGAFSSWEEVFAHLALTLEAHLEEVVAALARDAAPGRVVALTTCFGQLFANLAVCRRLKETAPSLVTVLGGSTVSARVGPSILAEYPFVDAIVQGEGELPLVAFLDAAGARPWPELPAVLHRDSGARPARLWEVKRLAELPVPDYDEYATLAGEQGIDWAIPIEGSRGCWWDRTARTGDPRSTCYFCNLNVQWGGYREKPVARVVREMDELSERYQNTRMYFLDNILRARGALELAHGIAGLGKHFDLFYELRASVRPAELLALWEAGLTGVQFGIEGLSSSLLRRIGKGTSVIQNLQAMKLCAELGIENLANLIVDFPGSTREEVAETARNLLRYALPYQPLQLCPFFLGVGSTVDTLRAELGVENVRNRDLFRAGLPEAVWRRLSLFDLDFDDASGTADWSAVHEATGRWRARHVEVDAPLLVYYDGGTFLTIVDRREDYELVQLGERLRSVYLACMSIRTRDELMSRFPDADEALQELAEDDLLFHENGRYLALAMASSPRHAAARIRGEAGVALERSAVA